MDTDLIVDIGVPKVLLLDPGVSDPDTYELLFLLLRKHLQLRTRSTCNLTAQEVKAIL